MTAVATVFLRGNTAHTTAVFKRTADDELVDPDALRCIVRSPNSETPTTYEYGSGVVLRDSVGSYYADIPLNYGGQWQIRWESDGDWAAAAELTFKTKGGYFDEAPPGL